MGEPLPGANIVLVGGTRGVATDIDGSFCDQCFGW